MDTTSNCPVPDEGSVAKENVNSLPNDQVSDCEWCRRYGSCAGISCFRRQRLCQP